MSDTDVAEMIRADGIDVLVDLAVHTHGGRPLAFAQRAAPLQLTWLGYCGTTGLDAMDYRLSDPLFDPPGETESLYSERTVHLPTTFWCYAPPEGAGDAQPRAGNGEIVFASLNNYSKVSRPALEAWAEILVRVPDSRLVIHCLEGTQRQAALDVLAAAGVEPQRVTFFAMLPMAVYLERLQEIDIALDSFPFAGGMTTCDALWMGVPVVTLRGRTAVGRGGTSILMNIGLPECITATRERYIEKAVHLALDRTRLSELRHSLRHRMQASPLMDAPRFARDFETALRKMWQDPRTRP
jgi:predicted O-linked N-acetylglucosamine transferase (SPINDLY family)